MVVKVISSGIIFSALATLVMFYFWHPFNFLNNNSIASEANKIHIGQTVEAEGIEITLISAYKDVFIHAMLQVKDSNKDRISDDVLLLFENLAYITTISTPVYYDETSGKALVGVIINPYSPIDTGENISLTIETILSGVNTVNFPSLISSLPPHLPLQVDGISRAEWEAATSKGHNATSVLTTKGDLEQEPQAFLNIDELSEYIPGIDWAVFSNIGFLNGLVHVQVRRIMEGNQDSIFDYMVGLNSYSSIVRHPIQPVYKIQKGLYTEYVFDGIGSNLWLLFSETDISGPWTFNFNITEAERRLMSIAVQDSPYFKQLDIEVLPMTTSINFSAIAPDVCVKSFTNQITGVGEVYLTLKDGSHIELFLSGSMFGFAEGSVFFNSFFFDIAQLCSITILGYEYSFE